MNYHFIGLFKKILSLIIVANQSTTQEYKLKALGLIYLA
jgi:hypothetical protein